jgi:hypothetical protein
MNSHYACKNEEDEEMVEMILPVRISDRFLFECLNLKLDREEKN